MHKVASNKQNKASLQLLILNLKESHFFYFISANLSKWPQKTWVQFILVLREITGVLVAQNIFQRKQTRAK